MKYIIFAMTALFVCSCTSAPPPRTFSVSLQSPSYEAEKAEAYFEPFFGIGNLKKGQIGVTYYPIEDAVCLQFKIQFVNCRQFWDKTARDAFIAAFTLYKEEYEQKKLTAKGKKAREVYGKKIPAYFMMRKSKLSYYTIGNPELSLGYQFWSNAVFFTTTQAEFWYQDPVYKEKGDRCPVILTYFTIAQAESLIELFNQDYLKGLIGADKLISPDAPDEFDLIEE